MKKIIIACLVMTLPISAATAKNVPDEQKIIINFDNWSETLSQGELFDDLDTWSFIPSQLQPPSGELDRLGLKVGTNCEKVEDPKCQKFLAINVKAFIPTCENLTTQYCIEEFYAIKDRKKISGIYKSPYPATRTFGQFDAEPKYDLPAGGAGNLWQLPGLVHDGGTDLYWLNSQLLGSVNRASTDKPFGKTNIYEMWSSISAVSEIGLPSSEAPRASEFGGSGSLTRQNTPDGIQCLVNGDKHCLIAWPLNESISYGIKIRIARPIEGWLHGRINNPEFSALTSSDGLFHLTMQGSPVKVPTLFASTPWANASSEIKARFGQQPSGCCGALGGGWYESAGRNQTSDQMVSDLNMWLPYVKDTASANPTYWIVRTTTNSGLNAQSCLVRGAINGVVTTNATAYTAGAPVFNKKYQSLDYKVASPHFDPNGGINIGNYNLQISSQVARCLYGFTSAPIAATISVLSNNGEKQVVTSTLKESNGWIYLKASGFTYSNPTVRVVFSQKKKPVKTK